MATASSTFPAAAAASAAAVAGFSVVDARVGVRVGVGPSKRPAKRRTVPGVIDTWGRGAEGVEKELGPISQACSCGESRGERVMLAAGVGWAHWNGELV